MTLAEKVQEAERQGLSHQVIIWRLHLCRCIACGLPTTSDNRCLDCDRNEVARRPNAP